MRLGDGGTTVCPRSAARAPSVVVAVRLLCVARCVSARAPRAVRAAVYVAFGVCVSMPRVAVARVTPASARAAHLHDVVSRVACVVRFVSTRAHALPWHNAPSLCAAARWTRRLAGHVKRLNSFGCQAIPPQWIALRGVCSKENITSMFVI